MSNSRAAGMTPGKVRGVDQLATDEGVFAVLAIDHRDSFRSMVDGEMTDEQITQFKIDLISGVGPCLLYTSPSPRDGLLSRMPSSA